MKHGGDLTEAIKEFGGLSDDWLDLSTGINPKAWPASPEHLALRIHRLPSQSDRDALVGAARHAYNVPDGPGIIPAAGTQALIQWLPYLAPSGAVAIVSPTYDEHEASWRKAGRNVYPCPALDQLPQAATNAILVNPNNPDGRLLTFDAIEHVAHDIRKRGGWLMIDEAFIDIDPTHSAAPLCAHFPIVVLRSFGKFYGLAGLRLGFAIAPPAIAARIDDALGPWAVSGPTSAIATAALLDTEWAVHERSRLQQQAARLDAVLTHAGLTVIGGTALFRLTRHRNATDIHRHLAGHRIWCRFFGRNGSLLRFGLPPDDSSFTRLEQALRDCVH